MIAIRIIALVALFGIGGMLVAWLATGDPRYRKFAWFFFLGSLVALLLVLLVFFFERLFGPLG